MNAHLFAPTAGSKSPCSVCGKTRNTKEHKAAKVDLTQVVAGEQYDTDGERVEQLLDEVESRADEQARVDAEERELNDVKSHSHTEQEAKAPAVRKSRIPAGHVRLWVGWRITNAAVTQDKNAAQRSLAAKLRDAKPTSELDRYVVIDAKELGELDKVAEKFAAAGNTGPVVYSARTLRRRIAAALDSLS